MGIQVAAALPATAIGGSGPKRRRSRNLTHREHPMGMAEVFNLTLARVRG